MKLVEIGNSKGIRLSKSIINKYGFSRGLKVVEEKKCIKIVPIEKTPRMSWQEFYAKNSESIEVDRDFLECGIDDGIK